MPSSPIVIVAHIFDSSSFAFAVDPGNGNEATEKNRTWRGLRALLSRADISFERCWLTNALMGVKLGRACGHVAAGPTYREQCAAFLALQIETVRPVVATLGTQACSWAVRRTYRGEIGARAERCRCVMPSITREDWM